MTRLDELTTLGLGGPARDLVVADTNEAAVAAITEADRRGDPVLVVGGGSNLVVSDAGFDGTVVAMRTRELSVTGTSQDLGRPSITVSAGVPWDELVAFTVASGLAGMEALSGIPGSSGATPVQNVGAYGQDVSQTISSVRVLDRMTEQVTELDAAECAFGYRTSTFKATPGRYVVLSVTFALTASGDSQPIGYPELARAVGVAPGGQAPLQQVRDAVLALRAAKGMVLDAGDPDTRSVGSFFTNPIVTPEVAAAVAERTKQQPPQWVEPDGRVKLSAAWLVQRAGFERGQGSARVRLSTKHALALTHVGGGTTAELVSLARTIRDTVRERLGVELVPEPTLVGVSL